MAIGPTREELIEEARRQGVSEPEKLAPRELERLASTARPSQSFWSRFLGRVRGALGTEVSRTSPPPANAPPPEAAARNTELREEPIPTRTMAGLLAAQGHEERALAIYERLIQGSGEASDDLQAEAAALRGRVEAKERTTSEESRSPVVAVVSERSGVLIAWDVSGERLRLAQAQLGSAGTLTARTVIVRPDPCLGAEVETWERDGASTGEWALGKLPTGTRITSAIGYRRGARFVSAAHSSVIET